MSIRRATFSRLIGRISALSAVLAAQWVLVGCGSGVSGCLLCTTSTTRQFAIVANAGGSNVSAYSVDGASGVLTAVPGSPFAAGTNPNSVTVANSGTVTFTSFPEYSVQFAYVVNNGSGSVSAYSIDAVSGALASLPGSPFAVGSGPVSMVISTGNGLIPMIASAAEGSNTDQNTLTFDPNFAYVVNHDTNSISAFTIDSNKGTLSPVPGSPFSTGSGPVSLTVLGRFAYVVDNGSNDVSAYAIDSTTGALTPIPGSPFATASSPVGLTAGQSSSQSTFVYVANSASGNVSAYFLNATTGALTSLVGSPFPAGNAPVALALASGFAYVLNQGSNDISGYAIDNSTGALTAVAGSPFAVGANPVQLTAYAGSVFAVNAGGNSVSVFAVGSSGVLAPLPRSPYATGARPAGLTPILSAQRVTPVSHQYFALVPSGGSNNVSAFTLDAPGGQYNGILSAVSGSPFAAGTNPDSVATITTTVTVPGN